MGGKNYAMFCTLSGILTFFQHKLYSAWHAHRRPGRLLCGVAVSLTAAVALILSPAKPVSAASLSSTTSLPSAGSTYYKAIDISHYNTVNWSKLDSRLDAVYMKATQGTSYVDPTLSTNVQGAQSRGIAYGFYHYLNMDQDAATQAEHFYNNIKLYYSEYYKCVPVLDVEFDTTHNIYSNNTYEGVRAMIQTFITRFEQLSGDTPVMIYCGIDMTKYLASNGTASASDVQFLSQQRLWIAAYKDKAATDSNPLPATFPNGPQELWNTTVAGNANNTAPIYIWSTYDVWQYTNGMSISGVSGGVDGDWATAGIFISTPETLSSVDAPIDDPVQTFSGYNGTGFINIKGWELSRSGISRVDFYDENNNLLGSTSDLSSRPDVQSSLNSDGYYSSPSKCGYKLSLYAPSLDNGTHTLRIAGVSNNGTINWNHVTIIVSGQAYTVIDTPSDNPTYYSGDIKVSGWASNASGIGSVNVTAYDSDGTVHALGSVTADSMSQRLDVVKSIPSLSNYPNALNSGYSLTVSASALKSGTYTLAVDGVGKDGGKRRATKTITVASPQMALDIPDKQEVNSGSITVKGWALNHSGVSRVDVYAFDSQNNAYSLGSISSFSARSDVLAAYSTYKTLNSGFSQSFSLSQLKQGKYTLSVAAIGRDNEVQWSTCTFTYMPPPRMAVDAPADGAYSPSSLTVSGWALSYSGISRVDFYAYDSNGKAHSLGSVPASAFTARVDVSSLYPVYNTSQCGFSLNVNTFGLQSGSYTLAVAAISNDGTVQWDTRAFYISSYQSPQMSVDTPSSNTSVSSSLTVSGWALNSTGVSRVDMYAFDKNGAAHFMGSVSSFSARADVQNAFPLFGTLRSGFSEEVSVSSLPAGKYTLSVAAIGNNGRVQWNSRTFIVSPSSQMAIDSPISGSSITQELTVSGWALNHSGVSRVDIYAFDKNGTAHFLGSTSTFNARMDVKSAFPDFGTVDSGFSQKVSVNLLSSGNYTLSVAAIGNDGDIQWMTRSIFIK